jgi:hypothetical protein
MTMSRSSLPKPEATIDLHGKTKSESLKRLTSFMDQVSSSKPKSTNVWVLVITGSGAHSNTGPILRTSVESLFQKRKMKYMINPGKGSFSVDVNSGFQLFEPEQPIDTKVVISETSRQEISSLAKHRDRVRSFPRSGQENPLPSEVAATDAFLEESWREGQKAMAEQQRDGHLLQKAMSMSVLEQTEQMEEEEGEAKMLRRALSMSMIENLPEPRDDENEIQKALELSKQEFELEQEDDPIQLALELSRKVSCKEDEDLLQILEQSKVQF